MRTFLRAKAAADELEQEYREAAKGAALTEKQEEEARVRREHGVSTVWS